MTAFHNITFPRSIALGARGGPVRRTEIVTQGNGNEQRNARWAHSRRRWDAGFGIKTMSELEEIIAFFEERRGRFHSFRWHDALDYKSCVASANITATDQPIGIGDGTTAQFQLRKIYGSAHNPYSRPITKPILNSVIVSINNNASDSNQYSIDELTGSIIFETAYIPQSGEEVRAGFAFDVPVRFDTDALEIDMAAFQAGEVPNIPIIEVLE